MEHVDAKSKKSAKGEIDSEKKLSQLDQIEAWQHSLESLKEDTEFASMADKKNDHPHLTPIIEAIAYLDRQDAVLEAHQDVALSESGFAKYKEMHLIAFEYLSQLATQTDKNFYLFSIKKHIKQQHRRIKWSHAIIHFMLIPIVLVVAGFLSLMAIVKTEHNSIVIALILWFCFVFFRTASSLIKQFRKTSLTPLRFIISLLGIHAMSTLLLITSVAIVPFLSVKSYNPYWIDDVIIISLLLICVFNHRPKKTLINPPTVAIGATKELANA